MKKFLKFLKAFSLVEMMVNIIAISVLTAAMAPVITKKVKASRTIVNASNVLSPPHCSKFTDKCTLCYPNECIICQRACSTLNTSAGKTSSVVNKQKCKCAICAKDAAAASGAGMLEPVTNDPYCFSCTLGNTKCTKCMTGYYLSSSSVCTGCQAGYKCNGKTRTACSAGYYAEAKSTTCTKCPSGKYSSSSASASCLTCGPGTRANATIAATSCQACIAGYHMSGSGATICTKCGAGTRANATSGATACLECGAGTYSGSGATACTKCSPGSFQDKAGQDECKECPAGRYSNTSGVSVCTKCGKGKYQKNEGATSCINCPTGQYTETTGSTTCKGCSNVSTGCNECTTSAVTCTKCSGGYKLESGKCTQCAAGKYSATGATSCTNCPAGKFNTVAGSTSCSNCAAGKFNTSAGSTSCSNCAAGKFNTSAGSTKCTNCGTGKYSAAGASACTNCPKGTKANATVAATSCTNCPAGTYQDTAGSTSCTNCASQKYSTVVGRTSACAAACSSKTANCSLCNKETGACTTCKSGYKVSGNSCIVNEIKPTNQAACNAIAGGGGKLCYFSYDSVGYCMTIKNVTAGAKKIFSSDSTSNICKDTNDLSCCWKHDSGYLCNNHAARSACSNYSINGNSNFSNLSRAKLSTAFKNSACDMITYSNYGSKDSCETDDGDNTYDGEGCEPFYYYTGQDGNKMQAAEFKENTTKTVNNKALPVRCATTVGTPN